MSLSLAMEEDDRRRGYTSSRSRDQRYQDEPQREQPRHPDIREPNLLLYPHKNGLNAILPGPNTLYGLPEDTMPVYRTAALSLQKEPPYRDGKGRDGRIVDEAHLPGAFPEDDYAKRDSVIERRKRHTDDYDPRHGRYDRAAEDSPRARQFEPAYHGNSDGRRNGRHDGRDNGKYDGRDNGRYDGRDNGRYDGRHDGGYDDNRGEIQGPRYQEKEYEDRKSKYLPQKYRSHYDHDDHDNDVDLDKRKIDRRSKNERDEDDLAYGSIAPILQDDNYSYGYRALSSDARPDEGRPSRYHDGDGDIDDGRVGDTRDEYDSNMSHRGPPRQGYRGDDCYDDYGSEKSHRYPYSEGDRDLSSAGNHDGRDRSPERRSSRLLGPPPTLIVNTDLREGDRSRDRSRDRRENGRDSSPPPPGPSRHRTNLSVDTTRLGGRTLASAPPSPLLESYHGTYQDCSPMPSPLILPARSPISDDLKSLEALSPLNSDGEGSKKLNRRARFHDAEDIASRLAQALKGNHTPKIEPLVEILPSLTHEQVMELRAEYKQIVKTGSDRKGVNIAKHIRARLKDEDPVLMKACYAVALGRWESEAYWANFWYQGDKTRRELLIESLMGRTNDEIRRIKDSFTDKKYDNSLTRCMKTELKEDKFKKAVLMVLDEGRMEEYDYHGRRLPIDYKQVDTDVAELRKAIKSERGGETLMISIVVQRSESHLRAVLQEYEQKYRANFAREALKKSGNLVGELLAHILNGIINRPVRDALLLNHALTASRKDQLRQELLISRLIRYHWDPAHMNEVKRAYRERYGQDLGDAVKEATTSEWGLFCRELCIVRMPDHVRRIERVDRVE